MPTVFTHPAIPLALRALTGGVSGARTSRRLLLVGALCSVLPDVDALGYFAGVPYESLFGHRGITHSLPFALLLAAGASAFAQPLRARKGWVFAFVLLSTVSHGVLDALTDGGLGVAFLSPFSNQRFFFPWRPIPVSPIGVEEIFTPYGARLLAAELVFLWLPCLIAAGIVGLRARTRLRVLVIACALAAGYGIGASARPWQAPATVADGVQTQQDEAIQNLQRQAEKLARLDGSSCPQDFSALDGEGALRISLFHAYDEHEGRVYDRLNSHALLHVLTGPCRGSLSACNFSVLSRSTSETRLAKTVRGRNVEIHLFTTSLPEDLEKGLNPFTRALHQDRLSRTVKERFYRELVASDVVFYMGHSRLGGGMGFDNQTGATTLVNSVLRLPLAPVLDALRQRPTRLRILGMFSCNSEGYFLGSVREANPSLSLILTSGDLRYGPGEQTSFGALEAVLSHYCGHAFHESMIAAGDPEPNMTRRFPGLPVEGSGGGDGNRERNRISWPSNQLVPYSR